MGYECFKKSPFTFTDRGGLQFMKTQPGSLRQRLQDSCCIVDERQQFASVAINRSSRCGEIVYCMRTGAEDYFRGTAALRAVSPPRMSVGGILRAIERATALPFCRHATGTICGHCLGYGFYPCMQHPRDFRLSWQKQNISLAMVACEANAPRRIPLSKVWF